MTWFKIDDAFHCHPKVLAAGNEAIGLYVRCGSWCAQQLTDGWVPCQVAVLYGATDVDASTGRLIDGGVGATPAHHLIIAGLWEASDGGFWIHDYLDFNRSRDQVLSERKHKTARQKRWRDRLTGQYVDASTDASVDGRVDTAPTRPDPTRSSLNREENNPSSSEAPAALSDTATQPKPKPRRDDVEQLCSRLVSGMVANGCKPPTVTDRWRDAARLLLDRDGRELDKALRLVDWCQADEFWRTNIQSMTAFRKQYDRMRMRALDEHKKRTASNGHAPTVHRDPTTGRAVEW